MRDVGKIADAQSGGKIAPSIGEDVLNTIRFRFEFEKGGELRLAASAAVIQHKPARFIEVPAGSCVFHCGEVWHGSAANSTGDRMRRAIGVHMLPANARFSDRPGGYIYRRYQRTDDPTLDESYFPILWSRSGQRTIWIENYCASGLRRAA
jgi:phytanoyl-CoA hydroxylase